MKNSGSALKDFGLILLCIVGSLAVFVAFLMIENLFLLLAIILAGAAVIYLFAKVDGIKTPIVEAFRRRRRFVFVTVLVVIILLPFILRSSPYWIYILTIAILWIIVCLGINIQFGSAGIINWGPIPPECWPPNSVHPHC
jgi:accessory gene regulator protein AgrB